MRIRVVYDSLYGNTKMVAESIARSISEALGTDVPVQQVGEVQAAEVASSDLLVLGAPTHGSEASSGMQSFLEMIGGPSGMGRKVALFDTRLTWRFLAKYGYAADKMATVLQSKGWQVVGSPSGFTVGGLKKGPLKKGELRRAAEWARGIAASLE